MNGAGASTIEAPTMNPQYRFRLVVMRRGGATISFVLASVITLQPMTH
jgi:hypothetical protein